MSKESVNYKTEGSVVVKRSPSVSGRKNKTLVNTRGSWIKRNSQTGEFHKSISRNIYSLGKLIKESEQILPRPQNKIK
jgi:hypothetical protein